MKALVLQTAGRLELADVARPESRDDEVLVRTRAALICTSDINDVRENPFGIALPIVIGHEGAGTVAAVGADVRGLRVGDRVAAHPVHPCGQCANCRDGLGHLCSSMGHFGMNMPGTFADYFCARADRVRVIPETLPFPVAALAEPVCVCLEALDQARLAAGSRLLILGDGPFGLLTARLAAARGVARTVIAGHHDFRLGFARDAVRVNVAGKADALEFLLGETDGRGYDAAVLAVGKAEAVRQGITLLKPHGRLVVFSAIPGETPVDLFNVHLKELDIVGACNDAGKLDEAMALLSDPALALGDFITHRFPLADYAAAFDLAAHGRDEAMKVAFVFAEDEE